MIFTNFLVGLPLMLLCLVIQALTAFWCVRYFVRQMQRVKAKDRSTAGIRPLLVSMIAIMLGTLVQIGLWGILFTVLGEFTDIQEAVYHSAVNFSSLGYGDVVMSAEWKLLGPLEGTSGVLMLGMSSAALMVILQQLIKMQFGKGAEAPETD